MKKSIILITGNELRHLYLACYLSSQKNIELKLVIHESNLKLEKNDLYKKDKLIKKHIDSRNKTEKLFFKRFVEKNKKYNFINIKKGSINEEKNISLVKKENVDYIITFGCSIINQEFINNFKNKIFNIHLGLSPYYKGSGTNFFPFVNNELQFCGSTIMQISKKIDGGKIVHQVRPDFTLNDNIHTVGNNIIVKTALELCKIIIKKKKFKFFKIKTKYKTRIYKRKDFSREALELAIQNIKNNLVSNYVRKYRKLMEKKYPIKKQL
jgi:phosphoribosylglycinamide formyltransferase 1